jgi:hypothetical protein
LESPWSSRRILWSLVVRGRRRWTRWGTVLAGPHAQIILDSAVQEFRSFGAVVILIRTFIVRALVVLGIFFSFNLLFNLLFFL